MSSAICNHLFKQIIKSNLKREGRLSFGESSGKVQTGLFSFCHTSNMEQQPTIEKEATENDANQQEEDDSVSERDHQNAAR